VNASHTVEGVIEISGFSKKPTIPKERDRDFILKLKSHMIVSKRKINHK